MNPFKRMRRAWNLSRAHGRGVVNSTLSSIGGLFGMGGYAATDPSRGIMGRKQPTTGTANQLLTASLPQLRAYCRHLERNNPTARAAVEGHVALIVGSGIALEPDSGDKAADERIRAVWLEFIKDCCVNGEHDIYYLEAQALRETVVAGEFLWRFVVEPELIDQGKIPIAVLPLEAEWLHQLSNTMGQKDANGVTWVNGVGVNEYGKPVAYRLTNPELNGTEYEEFKASEIAHDFERRRALQARGEPWFSPVIEVMQQERDLVDAELKSAVNTSALGLAITSEHHDDLDTNTNGNTDDPAQSLRIGGVARLFPGEEVTAFSHTRPSQQIAPFRTMLCGDNAGALRLPQRFFNRDVSRANYSSMRADMLDSERLLAPVREWFGHATIGRLYKAALPWLAMQAGIKTPSAKYRLVPDGQPYVDPEKDVKAALLAIVGGLSTWEKEVGKRGEDAKKLVAQLEDEIKNPLLNAIFAANLDAPKPAAAPDEKTKQESSDD